MAKIAIFISFCIPQEQTFLPIRVSTVSEKLTESGLDIIFSHFTIFDYLQVAS